MVRMKLSKKDRERLGIVDDPRTKAAAELAAATRRSQIERLRADVADVLAAALGPRPVHVAIAEYRFSTRKWRFDWAFPDVKLAIEIEGGSGSNGRHTRPSGYADDCEKYNRATLNGWRLLRYTSEQIRKERARVVAEIREGLALGGLHT